MNSAVSTRLQTSKSRIPVSLKYKKPSNVNIKETLIKQADKVPTSTSCRITNPSLKKEVPKVSSSHPVKSVKVTNNITSKNSKLKEKAESSVRTTTKPNCNKEKESVARTNIKSVGNKGKELLQKKKPVLNNENKGKDLHSKNNLKCLDNERKKLPESTLKSAADLKKLPIPKITFEKENEPPSMECFSAQKDIKFEANEKFRNMILRERELSPSVCRLVPGLRMSSIVPQRPSAYEKFQIPRDPLEFKEALKALRNASLSVRREQELKQLKTTSPLFKFQDRSSFYTPCADPKIEVMKSLQKRKLKQSQKSATKSTKKVTFDLFVKECTPINNACDTELKSFKNSESTLTQINEKSEENTPNSPRNEKIETASKQSEENLSKIGDNKNFKDCLSHQEIKAAIATDNTQKCTHGTFCESPQFCALATKPVLSTVSVGVNSEFFFSHESEEPKFDSVTKINPVNLPPHFDIKQILCTKQEKYTVGQTLDQKTLKNLENIKIDQAKVYTPRPISFASKYEEMNSSSPEFLRKPASETFLKLAPICTPLVLKSMAKNTVLSPDDDLSPVRQKLDFSEKETPRNMASIKSARATPRNIVTSKNKLDELADEECCLLLLNESAPVVCGRYLTNPVAQTLTEGDEMHFIPIQF